MNSVDYYLIGVLLGLIIINACYVLNNIKWRKEYKRKAKAFEDMIKQHTQILNETQRIQIENP